MRVKMVPDINVANRSEGGINTVIRNYYRLANDFDIEFVTGNNFDVEAIHAGAAPFADPGGPNVSINHGLYWSNSQDIGAYELRENAKIIENFRHARVITTPSRWVAQTIRRDMRINPIILPHGVDWNGWQHDYSDDGYVIWAKNRMTDVCTPEPVNRLAARRPNIPFMATFTLEPTPDNVVAIGRQPYDNMKQLIQRAAVYMATQQETWGIATVEAMAAGKPILGFAFGNNPEIVRHGVNGYLAAPGDWDDLARGLDYCLEHADVLGRNSRELAKQYTWEAAMEILTGAFRTAMHAPNKSASVIIPCYNKAASVGRAIESALAQDHLDNVIVVDDCSTDGSREIIQRYADTDRRVRPIFLGQNGGVANARNVGVNACASDFFVLLDADDHIRPEYIATTLPEIVKDNSLGVVYTGMQWTNPDGTTGTPNWPGDYNFDAYMKRKPQVSTCALVRKSIWDRLGGQRDRYCKRSGAGSEDAEFWYRAGARGIGFKKVSDEPLFQYSSNVGITYQEEYSEADWMAFHTFQKTGNHPIASLATPDRLSHPAIARDRPIVSIIIPVGPGHSAHIADALDSTDAQTYDRYEVIVVDDSGNENGIRGWVGAAFPHAKVVISNGRQAGAARNRGVEAASGNLLYFLDADDRMSPDALRILVSTYAKMGGDHAIYSDYYAVKLIEKGLPRAPQTDEVLVMYDAKTGELVTEGRQQEYDCEIAQAQPTNPPYFWAIAGTLIPKSWHYEIGGFDEEMPSWEDCLYFVRLARHGKCFKRVPELLYVYNLNFGYRRTLGRREYKNLDLFRIIEDRRGDIVEMCKCKERPIMGAREQAMALTVEDPGTVLVMYKPNGMGKHAVYGNGRYRYGYRQYGDRLVVRKSDVKATPFRFVCPECENQFTTIDEARGVVECNCSTAVREAEVITASAAVSEPPPSPELIEVNYVEASQETKPPSKPDDLARIPGIGPATAAKLIDAGIVSFEQVGIMDMDELIGYGVSSNWAQRAIDWVNERFVK